MEVHSCTYVLREYDSRMVWCDSSILLVIQEMPIMDVWVRVVLRGCPFISSPIRTFHSTSLVHTQSVSLRNKVRFERHDRLRRDGVTGNFGTIVTVSDRVTCEVNRTMVRLFEKSSTTMPHDDAHPFSWIMKTDVSIFPREELISLWLSDHHWLVSSRHLYTVPRTWSDIFWIVANHWSTATRYFLVCRSRSTSLGVVL